MFKRNKEDFICEHCSYEVKGSGYTNHCPKCLWSKHVDVDPGDRAAECLGMMKPVKIEGDRIDRMMLTLECEKCHFKRRNSIGRSDDMDAVFELVKRQVKIAEARLK